MMSFCFSREASRGGDTTEEKLSQRRAEDRTAKGDVDEEQESHGQSNLSRMGRRVGGLDIYSWAI